MSFLNWRVKGFDPAQHVAALQQGKLRCPSCGRMNGFDTLEPLELTRCSNAKCNDMLMVPLHLAGFWLSKPLGAGGMGATYQAWRVDDQDPNRSYAVKVLPRDNKHNPKLIANIERESEIVMSLGEHPCIAHGIAAGKVDDEYYLASRYVDGERLDVRIERMRRMPELESIAVALRILAAETHIYNQGYLFRDLKPQNIIVAAEGAFLFDFGICEKLAACLIDDGADSVQGSAIYIPPERLTGEGERASAEIYSLGMVLYQMLKGEPYFNSSEIASLARQHVRSMRLANSEDKMKKIAPDTAEVIYKMIARDVAERFQNYAEVEYHLGRIIANRLAGAA